MSVQIHDKQKAQLHALEPDVRLSVVGGVAYLDGRVSCYERKKALSRLAAELPSVERVENRLRVAPGSLRSDRTIESEVSAALKIDPSLMGEHISVKVKDGVVELRGKVGHISARVAAERAAWSACGVQHVENRLEFLPQANTLNSLGRSA